MVIEVPDGRHSGQWRDLLRSANTGIGSFRLSVLDGSHTGMTYRLVPDSGTVVDGVPDMTEIANNDFVVMRKALYPTHR